MTYVGEEPNSYGNSRGVFNCEVCYGRFTVDPHPPKEQYWMWTGCMAPECESFDISRDVSCIVGFGWSELKEDKDD